MSYKKGLISSIAFLIVLINFSSSVCGLEESKNEIYYSYDQLTDLIEKLSQEYSDIFSYCSIGETYEGRDIWLVKISDNVATDEDEPEVLFIGGIHGCENPGYQVVIYTIEAMVENYTCPVLNESFTNRIQNIVNSTELYFIPMVNPDGVEANVRKNCRPNHCIFGKTLFRGVDINRNFDYKWKEFFKHPLKYGFFPNFVRSTKVLPFLDFSGSYRGPRPFSEPESRAIKHFVENHNVTISLDYHTCGEKIIYPWMWTNEPPPDNIIFLSIAENISNINGYNITQGSQWYYLVGSISDWLYGKNQILATSIELCDENGPEAPLEKELILRICEMHLFVNLYVAEKAITLVG